MSRIELVVFDLGGTTIEDRGDVPKALTAALKVHQIDIAERDFLEHRGRSKRDAIRSFVKAKLGTDASSEQEYVEGIHVYFQEELERRFQQSGVVPVPGAEKVFSWLREQGIKIALTTGFDRRITDTILERLSWQKSFFDATVCGDEVSQGRPAPFMIFRAMELTNISDVSFVIKVGDTPADIKAGISAGARTVGVLTGPHDEDSLRKANPTHIILSVGDLPDLFQQEGYT